MPVRGEGASVDAVQVYNENANTTAESVVSAVLSLAGQGSYERRYKESVLAPDIPVFVLGTVHEGGVIGAAPPGAKVKEFIITYKSKEQRTRSSGRMEIVMMVIAVVLFAAAAGSLIAAFKYP